MKLVSMYSAKIKEYNNIFKNTVALYRSATDFFIQISLKFRPPSGGLFKCLEIRLARNMYNNKWNI